ncbi:ornithine aminotransferase [Elysia marginata]|uniref:Ornithine aminotransferase n=1 Tax=Elysia marginata TaxID=1093978 RepID=A0AAV4G493_9GAST|nr:ornithine aminotransferase [Elysia marginata]
MDLEKQFGANNYHPIPAVLQKGKGVYVWDTEGKKYFDFLAAYSAVNQGHCHPRIVAALQKQSEELTLTSRAFYNDKLGPFMSFLSHYFGLEKVLPMNTGAEGVETAIKLCRKWGYEVKGINKNKSKIVVCENNFHGRTTTIISFSNDKDATENFGPFTEGFVKIPYSNVSALEKVVKDPEVVGFLVEPIQGEAGVYVPDDGYLKTCFELCKSNNVLFIADEIQTGLARTGKRLAIDYENIKPDILILGKALSGGVYPVSAVLADACIMDVIKPGQHGSTYGGNPIAARVSIEALKVIEEEKLSDHSYKMGAFLRSGLDNISKKNNILNFVRGKGLMNAMIINDTPQSDTAWNICLALKNKGLLAKPTHGNIIRLSPPLVITKPQLEEALNIISDVLKSF